MSIESLLKSYFNPALQVELMDNPLFSFDGIGGSVVSRNMYGIASREFCFFSPPTSWILAAWCSWGHIGSTMHHKGPGVAYLTNAIEIVDYISGLIF